MPDSTVTPAGPGAAADPGLAVEGAMLDTSVMGGSDAAAITAAVRRLWAARSAVLGIDVFVPECPYGADDLAALAAADRRAGYLPAELATQAGRAGLARLFPLLQAWAAHEDNLLPNDADRWGWFDYETGVTPPYTDTDEESLAGAVEAAGTTLLTLNQYIVASQDNYLVDGHYLDETGTWSRVASRYDGHAVSCRFDGPKPPDDPFGEEPAVGSLLVAYDLGSEDHGPAMGARSSTFAPLELARSTPPRTAFDLGRLPVPQPSDLAAERERLIARFVAAGYHEKLGLEAREYAESFPAIPAQPAQYRGRFDVPLLVETRISWRDQAALADVALGGGRLNLNYLPVDERSEVRPAPYVGWFCWWGQRFPSPIAPDDARAGLADDEVGANLNELIALHLAYPELNEAGRFFEPIGYKLDGTFMTGLSGFDDNIVRSACIYRWRGKAEIGANLHPIAFSTFRPLVRGTEVSSS